MNMKKLVNKMFNEIVQEYENEKMIQNGGLIKKTTSQEFLGGVNNV